MRGVSQLKGDENNGIFSKISLEAVFGTWEHGFRGLNGYKS
jgi:hypothetical protein